MTSLPNVVTSELTDVNTSTSFNVTMAMTSTKSLAQHVSPSAVSVVAIFLMLSLLNACGNGFTLITIRMTPKLWIKTNVIMTSMLFSYFVASISLICGNFYRLLAIVYNRSCSMDVVFTGISFFVKVAVYVSSLHTILISVERYIAIVHPLQYETTFTDGTLKRAISAIWMIGTFVGMTFALWLIDADLHKCALTPVHYQLLDVVIFTLVCICLLICYGKIFVISWNQHWRIEPQLANANYTPGSSLQTTAFPNVTRSNRATTSDNTIDLSDKPMTGTESLSQTAAGASPELMQEQQWQKIKSRRREFKAAYVIAAMVSAWAILTIPRMINCILESVGYFNSNIMIVGGALGTLKFASAWVIYVAVSKSYRRAYRQMLFRVGCCFCKNLTLPADNSSM